MLNRFSAFALALSGSTLLVNLATFRTPRGAVPAPAPKVSVLVPARNEELNIRVCVESLLAQDYPDFELLVLDDHSEDNTRQILRDLSHQFPERLTIIQGAPLPQGWAGKNWACHQLAQRADSASRYLLFTDADTIHQSHALQVTVAEAQRHQLVLLSLMPEQQVESLAEQLIVPLFGLQILGYLPLLAMEYLPVPAFAAANGQYLLFGADAYQTLGGHAEIAGEIAEDVSLARLAKGQGRIRLANGAGVVRCRMYRNLGEILRGFRRSFSSGFRIDPAISWMMVLLNAFAYFFPFVQLLVDIKTHKPERKPTPNLIVIGVIFLLRTLLAWRTRTSWLSVLGHPIGMGFVIYSQLLAAWDARVGQSTAWKGRHYTLKKE